MNTLSPQVIASFKLALKTLKGSKRRAYAAELAMTYFNGSARKTETALGVWRKMVSLGLHEKQSGIRCIESYHLRGAKKKS